MTEAQLQKAVIECAQFLGWRVAHFRPALTERGWRTPVSADGVGFPDLCMVRDRVIFAELKNAARKPDLEQLAWAEAIGIADGEIYLWRPDDWTTGRIEHTLRSRKEPQ